MPMERAPARGASPVVAGLCRTSQTAPILSDESDESDGAEYRSAVPSQLPRPALPPKRSLVSAYRHPQGVHRRQVWALSDESDGAYLIGRVGQVGRR